MHTKSYISAAALTTALLASPNLASAQGLGLNLNLGGIGVDANVGVGGSSLVNVDAGVGSGLGVGASVGGNSVIDVNVGSGSGSGDTPSAGSSGLGNLIDLGIATGGATGPNGGTLIDLGVGSTQDAALDVDLDILPQANTAPSGGSSALITGNIRIGALSGDDRTGALLDLIDNPNLADIDLDAAIDDRRVSIIGAADLLGADALLDVRAAIDLGGSGRDDLLDALGSSLELGSILDRLDIDLEDVAAVQIAENGATEIVVLDGAVDVAVLGNDGNLADLTVDDFAALDLDLFTDAELAQLDLSLLPDELAIPIRLRLLGDDSDLADLTVGDLAQIDLDLGTGTILPGGTDDTGTGGNAGNPGDGGTSTNNPGTGDGTDNSGTGTGTGGDTSGTDGNTGTGTGSGTGGNTNPGTGGGTGSTGDSGAGTGNTGAGTGSTDNTSSVGSTGGTGGVGPISGPAAASASSTSADARFGIAALGCDIGTIALASGMEASPTAIASARSLELVRIEGCERQLVDANVDAIRDAINANPAITGVLDDAQIPLDQVIGATIQAGTLTVFVEPVII